jgi:hypothetical protein
MQTFAFRQKESKPYLVHHHSENEMSVILSRSAAEAKPVLSTVEENLVLCMRKTLVYQKRDSSSLPLRFAQRFGSLLRMTGYQNQCGGVLAIHGINHHYCITIVIQAVQARY